jgi:hypothetical protein
MYKYIESRMTNIQELLTILPLSFPWINDIIVSFKDPLKET